MIDAERHAAHRSELNRPSVNELTALYDCKCLITLTVILPGHIVLMLVP